MKRWTEAEPRDSNITDYEQFNKEYNAQKSSLNGGIDRNQIAQSLVTKAMLKDYAMHRVYLNEHGEFNDSQFIDTGTTANTEGHFRGLTYTTYNGGWIPIVEQDYTGLKDGMVYMEFNAHLHMEVEFSMTAGNTINNKDVQLAITWNGTPILNTLNIRWVFRQYDCLQTLSHQQALEGLSLKREWFLKRLLTTFILFKCTSGE